MHKIKSLTVAFIVLLFAWILVDCAPKPTQPILVDAFFSGQAFLDANGNGQLDSADTPIENATLIVTLKGGTEVGGNTDKTGNAFITVPGGVDYPVTLRMEAPKGSGLKLIGPASITFPSTTGEQSKFLFSK
ncbi:MAG TPA: hypothetical protein VHM28_02685 [Anaerolineales bacterium]|nr:hypothetical protein [Anaerolineales bacterium]